MTESGLLEAGRDRRELGVESGAEAVYNCDDRERNAGGDQAVFNGGGAGFVGQELFENTLQLCLPWGCAGDRPTPETYVGKSKV
jgi:hypothetical protein